MSITTFLLYHFKFGYTSIIQVTIFFSSSFMISFFIFKSLINLVQIWYTVGGKELTKIFIFIFQNGHAMKSAENNRGSKPYFPLLLVSQKGSQRASIYSAVIWHILQKKMRMKKYGQDYPQILSHFPQVLVSTSSQQYRSLAPRDFLSRRGKTTMASK